MGQIHSMTKMLPGAPSFRWVSHKFLQISNRVRSTDKIKCRPAGQYDRWKSKAAGLTMKLPVFWLLTGLNF